MSGRRDLRDKQGADSSAEWGGQEASAVTVKHKAWLCVSARTTDFLSFPFSLVTTSLGQAKLEFMGHCVTRKVP